MSTLGAINLEHYAFTVEVTGIDTESDGYEDILYEAGCSDALIMVVEERLTLDFDRDAPTYHQAIEAARQAIEKAGGTIVDIKAIASLDS